MARMIELSKSRYCKGVQCPKILWMDQNMPEKAEVIDDSTMEVGSKVGELARSYFGDYELVDYFTDKRVMAEETRRLIEKGVPSIAEASFYLDGLFCSVDILNLCGDECDIVEVKSSTEVKEIYIDDVAFQYYVLVKCGMKVRSVSIMHIDSTYVRNGELDLEKLFCIEDYTEEAKSKYPEVERNIEEIRTYLSVDYEPDKDLDICCESPYNCLYYGYCARHLPEQSVFDIRRLKSATKYDYYHNGIVSFEDIVKKHPKLSANQLRQVETAYYDKPDDINAGKIREFLQTLKYPLYHLDFETFQQAIPEYDGQKPYEQIPFQYSLHIEYEDGRLEHREFLAKEGTDPRREIAESLCKDFPTDVCVLAYNMSFERGVITRLADMFPDLSDHLLAVRENICDLMIPFQKQYYYTKAMQGSYSIKYVLPALYPDDPSLDYHSLEGIHNGSEASSAFATLAEKEPEEIERIRNNLLKYCGLDTYAMVKVLAKLKDVCK